MKEIKLQPGEAFAPEEAGIYYNTLDTGGHCVILVFGEPRMQYIFTKQEYEEIKGLFKSELDEMVIKKELSGLPNMDQPLLISDEGKVSESFALEMLKIVVNK